MVKLIVIRETRTRQPRALLNLRADRVLYDGLGDLLARCIVAIRTDEADSLDAMTPEAARMAHLRVF